MLACDLAVAAEESRIGDFHIRHGLFAGAGTIYRLPRIVGLRKARELMLSGDVLDGRQAKAWNLVNETAPLADFDGLVERFTARFADKSPTIAWLTKLAVNRGLDSDAATLAPRTAAQRRRIGNGRCARRRRGGARAPSSGLGIARPGSRHTWNLDARS